MKKVAANSQRNKFLKSMPSRHLDPTVRPEAAAHALHRSFVTCAFELSRKSIRFEIAREAILELYVVASRVIESELWDGEWNMLIGLQDAIPEPSQEAREDNLVRTHKRLRSESATQKTLARAMESLDNTITSMRMELSACLIPDSGLDRSMESERYKCAALLGSIGDLLKRYWYPIRKKVIAKCR